MNEVTKQQTKFIEENQARLLHFILHHVSNLNEQVRCSIWYHSGMKPTSLSQCFHVFCEDCILTHLEYSTNNASCPICQRLFTKDELQSNGFLTKITEFIKKARDLTCTRLERNESRTPLLETVLKGLRTDVDFPELKSKDRPPPDYSLVLKARKLLIGQENEVISTGEQLPPVASVNFRNGSVKAPIIKKLKTVSRKSVEKLKPVKDLFDVVKENPVNPLFKTLRKYSTKKQNEKKQEQKYADKVIEFEDASTKSRVIEWLTNSQNMFDRMSQTQENLNTDSPVEFGMPSVSQLHNRSANLKKVPPITQINRQKLEQKKIREKNEIVTWLSWVNPSDTKVKRRARSLEAIKLEPMLKLKRHSIAVVDNSAVAIEQFTSEDEVTEKVICKAMEEKCLKDIEQDVKGKYDAPKRKTRSSTKEKNEKLNESTGWSRMKKIKKIINKVEKKPEKLNVTQNSKSVVSSGKKSTKKSQSVVLKEKNIEAGEVELTAKSRGYDLESLESYLSTNMDKILNNKQESDKEGKPTKQKKANKTTGMQNGSPKTNNKKNTLVEVDENFENSPVQERLPCKKLNKDSNKSKAEKNDLIKQNEFLENNSTRSKITDENIPSLEFIVTDKNDFKRLKSNDLDDSIKTISDNKTRSGKSVSSANKSLSKSRRRLFAEETIPAKVSKTPSNPEKEKSSIQIVVQAEVHNSNTPEFKVNSKGNMSTNSVISETRKNLAQEFNKCIEDKICSLDNTKKIEFDKDTKNNIQSSSNTKLISHHSDSLDSDDEIFLKPTQTIFPQSQKQPAELDNDIFTIGTQPLKSRESNHQQLFDQIKSNIQTLSSGVDAADFVSKLKVVVCGLIQDHTQINDKQVQTDFSKDISFFSHDASMQTTPDKAKDAAMQTEVDSTKGFLISANDMFLTRPTSNTMVQTDTLSCPKCNFIFQNVNKNSENILSPSFDNFLFETQDLVKGKPINGSESVTKKESIVPCVTKPKSQEVVNIVNDENKKVYKRIRQSTSDSDSDEESRKAKKSRFVRDDLSIYFESEPLQSQKKQPDLNMTGSEEMDYEKILQEALRKCDEDMGITKHQPKNIEPPPKRSKTQDLIEECKIILQEACSEGLTLQKTQRNEPSKLTLAVMEEEFHEDFNIQDKQTHSRKESVSKLTPGMEEEFLHYFVSQEKQRQAKNNLSLSKLAPTALEDDNKEKQKRDNPSETKLTPAVMEEFCQDFAEEKQKPKNKFSESLFSNTDHYAKEGNTERKLVKKDQIEAKSINELTDIMDEFDKSFEDADAEVESISRSIGDHTVVGVPEKVKILQNIVVAPADGYGEDSDVFLSDSDLVETTPQKNKPPLEHLSMLSQVYQNLDNIVILSPTENLYVPLDEVFEPPTEFQDASEPLVPLEPPQGHISSLTPDILPIEPQRYKEFVTSTPYFDSSQILPARSLTVSPIKKKMVNPIQAAQTCKSSPLNIVAKTPPPKPVFTTSTPKQKSILNYIQQDSKSSQLSQNSTLKPCLACTRMNKEQLMTITSMANKKLVAYTNGVSPAVTHLIVNTDERGCVVDHTMKYVCSVAAGVWVVNFKWVEDCTRQNALLPEELYEALDMSGIAGPKKSRLTRTRNPLLRGYIIHAAPPFMSTTQKEVENVLALLGAEVARRPDDLANHSGRIRLIITELRGSETFELYEMWLETLKVITVDLEWLSRSVGQYEKLSLRPFVLCSEDAICDLGYPSELLAEVPLTFMHN